MSKRFVSTLCGSAMVPLLGGTFIVATPLQPAYAQNISFDNPAPLAGTDVVDAEAPQIATSGRNVYIIWHEPPTPNSGLLHEVYFARSTNRGADFPKDQRTPISESPNIPSTDEQIAVSGQRVFVVWSEGSNQIWFRRSTNGGVSFNQPKQLSIAANALAPQIAVSGKNVYVAWEADDPLGNNKVIYFTKSADAGVNFDMETDISKSNGAIGSQFQPHVRQIAVSGDHVIVTWRDDRTDLVQNAGFNIYVAHGR